MDKGNSAYAMLIRLASVYRSVNIGQKRGAKNFTMHRRLSQWHVSLHTDTVTQVAGGNSIFVKTPRHIPWSREPLLTMVQQATWGAEDNIMRTLRERQQQHWG